MSYPQTRMQRYRQNPTLRTLFAEHTLRPECCIQPLFIHEGLTEARDIGSLPGMVQHNLSSLRLEIDMLWLAGVRAVILFGIPLTKDATASTASDENGILQKAIRQIKSQRPEMTVIADCCLCEYTTHGHCGIPGPKAPLFDHDATLAQLSEIALSYAAAGVDIVAPSGMMDGMIQSLRSSLDQHGFSDILLMSYAVKYASAFYGPFRDAAGSGDVFSGNRRHHQMAYTQRKEALREAQLDVQEGADILMIKPGMPYLDIVADVRRETTLPVAVYQVSGEYAMLHAAAKAGVFTYEEAMLENLMAFVRAGANWIITYDAKRVRDFITPMLG
jgi:porphobilinogen synthase